MRTYSCFEALKGRDFGSNRCNVTAIMKKSAKFRRNQSYQKTANQIDLLLVNDNEFMLWMVWIKRIGKVQRLI